MPFSQINLAPNIVKAVKAMGYVDPTPIQLRAIPLALEGHDLIGSAQTGTGKTAAFALPILSKLDHHGALRALILEPTRELAGQVETALRDYARFTDLRAIAVYGGASFGPQARELRNGVDVLVATPGRLLDHLTRGTLRLDTIQNLVLDEADRMLDMGFLPDVRRIVERCPKNRQTFVFSATMPPEIEALVRWAMRTPKIIEIGHRRSPAETITHALYPVSNDQKSKLLLALMEQLHFDSMLVFTRTKHKADRIARLLKQNGHAVAVLHSNRTQRERESALRGFRDGRFDVLVATDIAARGLDVDTITHVVNYDIPQHPEDYVHRIGRTGRAAASGDALSLFSADDLKHVAAIERFIGRTIERKKLDGFEYSSAPDTPREQHRGGGQHQRGRGQGHRGGGGQGHRGQQHRGGHQRHSQNPPREPHAQAPQNHAAAAAPAEQIAQGVPPQRAPQHSGHRPQPNRHNPRPWERRGQ
ncbi:MAG TPA: DEAD/DEAH box helicase [Planctomycetota bacterium]|nr:DEAD/DEAH box helicase [Planctomycetota bacterium]